MRGFVRHCQIPLAVGIPSVMYENACLPTAHGKYCHPCLSGPSSSFLPHSGASLHPSIPVPCPSSPISHFPPPSLSSSLLGAAASPLMVLSSYWLPVPPWAQDLGGSSLGVRHTWSSNRPETHTQTSLWRRETRRELS